MPQIPPQKKRRRKERIFKVVKATREIKPSELYDADPACKHEIVDDKTYSGVKCRKCRGWFCY